MKKHRLVALILLLSLIFPVAQPQTVEASTDNTKLFSSLVTLFGLDEASNMWTSAFGLLPAGFSQEDGNELTQAKTESFDEANPTFYVDSVKGSRSGNGLTEATAFQSLAQLPLSNTQGDVTINLKCNSVWYETLSVIHSSMQTNDLTIQSYGNDCNSGNLPVIDGGMPLTNWEADPVDKTGTIFKNRSHVDAGFDVMTTQLLASNDGERYTVARFPNQSDKEPMLIITDDSDDINSLQTAEHYLIDRSTWSANRNLDPTGAEIHIRNRFWRLQDRIVTHFDRNDGELGWFESRPTTNSENSALALMQTVNRGDCYNCVKSGYSYYLANLRWMMDERDEWYQDRNTREIYLKTSGNRPSDGSVTASVRDHGIHIENQANLTIEDIAIRNTKYDGVFINRSYDFEIDGITVDAAGGSGIQVIAIRNNSGSATRNKIRNNSITNASTAGIRSLNRMGRVNLVDDGTSITIEDNQVTNIGNQDYANPDTHTVLKDTGMDYSNGRGIGINVGSGINVIVRDNTIENTAYSGVQLTGKTLNPEITDNLITNFTTLLDDGGGIYLGGSCYTAADYGTGSDNEICIDELVENGIIANNIIGVGPGNIFGAPSPEVGRAEGIYLDQDTVGTRVMNNTIYEADGAGVFINQGRNNIVEGNLIFNNKAGILLSEFARRDVIKNLEDNIVQDNVIVQLDDSYAITIQSNTDNYQQLLESADFTNNIYYAPRAEYLVRESSIDGAVLSSLQEWQQNRGQDMASEELTQYQTIDQLVIPSQTNLVSNSSFDTGIDDWICWFPGKSGPCVPGSSEPYIEWNLSCDLDDGACMTLAASQSTYVRALKADIDIDRNDSYLVEFSAVGKANNQTGEISIRKNNQSNNGWSVLGLNEDFRVGIDPQFFSYVFTATDGDNRAAAQIIADAGNVINIDNYTIIPVETESVGEESTAVLVVNDTNRNQRVSALVKSGELEGSNSYVDLNGDSVSLRDNVRPGESMLLILADSDYRDPDGDGVPENQVSGSYYDLCNNTPTGATVDRNGCTYQQKVALDSGIDPATIDIDGETDAPGENGEVSNDGEIGDEEELRRSLLLRIVELLNLLIASLLGQSDTSGFGSGAISIDRPLRLGDEGADVRFLQQRLNARGFTVANSGPGAPGQETEFFGPATLRSLQNFQCQELSICAGEFYTTGYGQTGPQTRALLNQ